MTAMMHLSTGDARFARRTGLIAALVVLGALVLPAAALISRSGDASGLLEGAGGLVYLARITGFTLFQAALSAIISVAVAVPLAVALARRPSFPGRGLLLGLFAVPLALPPLVAALGLIAIWGRQGVINSIGTSLGFEGRFTVYGLSGILIAHVFFNLPLACRLMLPALERLPGEYFRNAAMLGMRPGTVFRHVEWPAMRRSAALAAGLVFMLCITSFTLVLVLGGGPRATTLEVAIYQALRFDFDPARAAFLAALQILLTLFALAILKPFSGASVTGGTSGVAPMRPDAPGGSWRFLDGALIGLAGLFVGSPLAAVVLDGLTASLPEVLGEPSFRHAAMMSLFIAISAASLSLLLAFLLVRAGHAGEEPGAVPGRTSRLILMAAGSLTLMAPPVALGAGFLLLIGSGTGELLRPLLAVTLINALMALPFAVRVLEPAHRTVLERNGRLALSLGIGGLNRLRRVDLPAMRQALMTAFVFSAALSLGDLGAVAIFGGDRIVTLPWLLYQKMGTYRGDDAAALALILASAVLLLMLFAGRMERKGSGSQ